MVAVMTLLVLSMGVGSARPAAALGCDSRNAPDPRSPRSGISGLVAEPPAVVPTEDPFRPEAEPGELFDKYGTAGLWWPVYDPGCNPATEWGMRNTTGVGQWGQEGQNFFLNSSAAVRSWAWESDWLVPIDDTMSTFTDSVKGSYAAPMMGVALVAAGAFIAFKGRRAQLSESATLAGWAVGLMVLGMLAISAPTRAANIVDYYGVGSAQLIETSMSGTEVEVVQDTRTPDAIENSDKDGLDLPSLTRANDPFIGLTTREVAYQNWLVGMFGSSDSATAQEYGPRFYKAMALSWDEAALPKEERQKVEEQKRDDFKTAAEELRDADPAAFKVMQGKTAFEDRVATGWVSALLTGIITLFGFVAAVCVLLARLVARFGVMALPIVIPFGMVHQYRQPVVAVLKLIAGGVVTAIAYTVASGLMVRLTSAMLQSTMPLLLVVVICLGLTVVLLSKLRAGQVIRTVVGIRVARNLARSHRAGSDGGGRTERESTATEPARTRRESRPAPVLPELVVLGRAETRPALEPEASLHGATSVVAAGNGAVHRGRHHRAPIRRVVTHNGSGPILGPKFPPSADPPGPGLGLGLGANGRSPLLPDPTGAAEAMPTRPQADVAPGATRTASERNAASSIWTVDPPAATDERYYVPSRPSEQRRVPVPNREPGVYEDHVAELRAGQPLVHEFHPDPDRTRPRGSRGTAHRPVPRPAGEG
jgi:hypothetical protein